MNEQVIWLAAFLLLLSVLIITAEILHKKFHWASENSRKFLHVSGGFISLLLPLFFQSHWWVLALTSIAFIILFVTYKRKMLSSVHQVKRYTVGSVLFPIPVYACFLFAELKQDPLLFYLPVSLLAVSDTAAEIGGQRWGYRGRSFFKGQKTLAGTICFFLTATLVCFAWIFFRHEDSIALVFLLSLSLAFIAALTELVTLHGWDNLSVPAVVLLLLLVIR